MSNKILLGKLMFTVFLVTISLNSHAEKFNSKKINDIKTQIEADASDFIKNHHLGANDLIPLMNFHETASELSLQLEFLITLSYLYSEMSNKDDQKVVKEVIEDKKKIYQGKCNLEKENRYVFKIEDPTLAIKVNEFYKNMMESCDIVKKWN